MKKALLIVGHGSRSPEAADTFLELVSFVRDRNEYDFVEGAHMELAEPRIEDAAAALVEQGVASIVIVPYFLYEGMHIKRDIPAMIEELRRLHPGVRFTMAAPIGFEPVLAEIVLRRASAAQREMEGGA